jgi:Cellulase (glycosyl hydrolase family 5)
VLSRSIGRAVLTLTVVLACAGTAAAQSERWPEAKANEWYARQPWLVGSNYIPATAINELEMWQAETFDGARIDRELGWADAIGLNVMRVFLHDLPWQQDASGFKQRIDAFLRIAAAHRIRVLFVLFDSCWDPAPQPGRQRSPRPGIHNSGWVQSPGARALQDRGEHPRLAAYVKGVVAAFHDDRRIVGWDVWNEPDNINAGSYREVEPANKVEMVLDLLPKAFEWARSAGPTQPLTSGVWKGDWSSDEKLAPMERIQLSLSDVISFHSYDKPDEFEKRVGWLRRYRRPMLCTEYLARGNGSTFEGTLPIANANRVAAINWGLVAGKTQTFLPWDSWQRPYIDRDPRVWHHEIFRTDGTPYDARETRFIRRIVGKQQ